MARDIRNQYTIGYKPTTPESAGGYRTIRVDAKARGYGKLVVRTRSGYYAGQEQVRRRRKLNLAVGFQLSASVFSQHSS